MCLDDFTFEDINSAGEVRELYSLADIYLLEGLKVLCHEKLEEET